MASTSQPIDEKNSTTDPPSPLQTQYFSQAEIDSFRECFALYAQKGTLESASHLRYIMRCLGYSPTVGETDKYYRSRKRVDFASFLELLHEHSKTQNAQTEILSAFRAFDRPKRGLIAAGELRNILRHVGEHMSQNEVDRLFNEAGITNDAQLVRYEDLLRVVCQPLPDY